MATCIQSHNKHIMTNLQPVELKVGIKSSSLFFKKYQKS